MATASDAAMSSRACAHRRRPCSMRAPAPKPKLRSQAPARRLAAHAPKSNAPAPRSNSATELIRARSPHRGWRHLTADIRGARRGSAADAGSGQRRHVRCAVRVCRMQRANAALAGARETGDGTRDDRSRRQTESCSKRPLESERTVSAGEPLLEIGDPRQLESSLTCSRPMRCASTPACARRSSNGARNGADATVRRVEPAGFTKISALGVEEQRVDVILDFDDWSRACAALGDAYRVEVRIATWHTPSVLKVPTSALFRDGGRWAVYVARGDRDKARSSSWDVKPDARPRSRPV